MSKDKKYRKKDVPESKKTVVAEIKEKIENSRTTLLASCKGLPGPQFHEIKKTLRGKAEITVAKKSAILRAIDGIDRGYVKNLKKEVG